MLVMHRTRMTTAQIYNDVVFNMLNIEHGATDRIDDVGDAVNDMIFVDVD